MIEWLKQAIAGQIGRSVIRKGMVLVSGFLLGANLGLDPALIERWQGDTTEILIAVLVYAIAQGWSLAEKRLQKKLIAGVPN